MPRFFGGSVYIGLGLIHMCQVTQRIQLFSGQRRNIEGLYMDFTSPVTDLVGGSEATVAGGMYLGTMVRYASKAKVKR